MCIRDRLLYLYSNERAARRETTRFACEAAAARAGKRSLRSQTAAASGWLGQLHLLRRGPPSVLKVAQRQLGRNCLRVPASASQRFCSSPCAGGAWGARPAQGGTWRAWPRKGT
eukprot:940733-Pyramimonas_sp.AAC.1